MYSCFDYYPLVWQFCLCKLGSVIEQIKKGFLRIIFNDNERVYETSTKNIVKKTLNINRMRYQATEIFKTSNNLNSSFVKGIFLIRERPNNITFKSYNTAMYGDNSLTTLDIIIGNSLSTNIKPGSSYST